MHGALEAIYQRRAIKVFEPVEISDDIREQILDAACHAPSSFNLQPYKFYWVQSTAKQAVVKLCLGQKPAETASALVVAVADLQSLSATTQAQLEWMRRSNFTREKVDDYERTAKIGRILFMPGPLQLFAAAKWAMFRLINVWKILGMPPTFRNEQFKWATKSTSLACQNLMIAAQALGMNTCPMEGFDGRRLLRFLGLSGRHHEIVMVIAIGKKSDAHNDTPQWRRSLNGTVTVL
jgi:nitroreductase